MVQCFDSYLGEREVCYFEQNLYICAYLFYFCVFSTFILFCDCRNLIVWIEGLIMRFYPLILKLREL